MVEPKKATWSEPIMMDSGVIRPFADVATLFALASAWRLDLACGDSPAKGGSS